MSEEKQLSLSDLGVEAVETPAEKASRNANNEVPIDKTNKPKIVKPSMLGDIKITEENIVTDINSIAEKPISVKENPVRKTLDSLYEMADENIDRTKKEIQPRIDEAKRAYIQNKWELLEKKAAKNPNIAAKIKIVEDKMDSDARFDDIDDYLRHGYILTVVAHDMGVGIDDKFFGIKPNENGEPTRRFRNSKDAMSDIEKTVKPETAIDIYNDEDPVSLNKPNKPNTKSEVDKTADPEPVKNETSTPVNVFEQEKTDLSDVDLDSPLEYDDDDDEDTTDEVKIAEDDSSIDVDDIESDEDDDLSEDEKKKIMIRFGKEIQESLKPTSSIDFSDFTIESKPVKVTPGTSNMDKVPILWALQYAKTSLTMLPFCGEDLIAINPYDEKNTTTIPGLTKIFTTIYKHIADNNKPDFDTWLKNNYHSDIDGLFFAAYVANFKDSNILSHSCPNNKCQNAFVKKHSIESMIIYPNDEVKKEFHDIMKKPVTPSKIEPTKPIPISTKYAIAFAPKSIYSGIFEPLLVSKELSEKALGIVSIMPYIHQIYEIDMTNRRFVPVTFGKAKDNDPVKNTTRKIKGLLQIFRTFSSDERATVINEITKLMVNENKDKITYQTPEVECPNCKTTIPAKEDTPLNLLFTRAQLLTIAASLQELA